MVTYDTLSCGRWDINELRAVQPEGLYLLGGFCTGGVVAFEMAQQLQAQGQKVASLVLLDTGYPVPVNFQWLLSLNV